MGDLDPTFGGTGLLTTGFQGSTESSAQALAVQPDGKLVMVGGPGVFNARSWFLARYQGDGSLDPSFGSGGVVSNTVGWRANAVVLQGDGRIIAAGVLNDRGAVLLERYSSNGSLDTSFGSGGIVTTTITASALPVGLALQPDGKVIVAAGTTVGRFNSDGSLDLTFGMGGSVTNPSGTANSVAVQADGKIDVAGGEIVAGEDNAFVLVRYNSNGSVDSGFGNGGQVTKRFSASRPMASEVLVQPDGEIVIAGRLLGPLSTDYSVLLRYNPDGTQDPNFGSAGQVALDLHLTSLALQSDGAILVAGSGRVAPFLAQEDFAMVRLTPSGASDPTFGTQGAVNILSLGPATSVVMGPTGHVFAVALASPSANNVGLSLIGPTVLASFTAAGNLDPTFGMTGQESTPTVTAIVSAQPATVMVQPDGRILVAGAAGNSTVGFALARYNSDGSLDPTFGSGGRVTTRFSAMAFLSEAVLEPDGKIVVVGGVYDLPGGQPEAVLARYNSDGTLDPSFGSAGEVIGTFRGLSQARLLALQPDGKILVGGGSDSGLIHVALVRFNPDGSPDTGFVPNLPRLGPNQSYSNIAGLAVQPDEKIALSLLEDLGSSTQDVLVRLNANGSLDATFGSGGATKVDFLGTVHVQLDGRIVLVGPNNTQGPTFDRPVGLARFYPNGNPDTTFGTSGKLYVSFGSGASYGFYSGVSAPSDVTLQPDGKIVVASRGAAGLFAVARFDPNGGFDPSFGMAGIAMANLQDTSIPHVSIALQPDGRIVMAGTAYIGQVLVFGLARFLGDTPISDPNQRFVTHLYLDLLERSPDASGLMAYTVALNQGQFTRTQLVQLFVTSPEYRTLEVQGLYGRLLGRPADAAGLITRVSFLEQGGTLQQLEALFLGSAEYANQRSGGSAAGFLQTVYGDVLQRPLDPGGAQVWGQALSNGIPPVSVATAILTSPEAAQIAVQDLYLQILHRATDPSGLSRYSSALQQGLTDEQLLTILAASDEYFGPD